MAIEHVVANILLVVLVILYLISDYELKHVIEFIMVTAILVTLGLGGIFLAIILFLGWAAS
jgi:formate/nitrite transporter FocA (FNT family)